jgi:hypothetical protein
VSGGGVAQGHKELFLANVVGTYCNYHISYNTYIIDKHISYSHMIRISDILSIVYRQYSIVSILGILEILVAA